MKTLKERIAVEQAGLDGKTIETKKIIYDEYDGKVADPKTYLYNWQDNDYRIKPEPITLYGFHYQGEYDFLASNTSQSREYIEEFFKGNEGHIVEFVQVMK